MPVNNVVFTWSRIRAFVSAHGRQHGGGSSDTDPASEEAQLLLWRRHIYRSNLYALPTGDSQATSSISLLPDSILS